MLLERNIFDYVDMLKCWKILSTKLFNQELRNKNAQAELNCVSIAVLFFVEVFFLNE